MEATLEQISYLFIMCATLAQQLILHGHLIRKWSIEEQKNQDGKLSTKYPVYTPASILSFLEPSRGSPPTNGIQTYSGERVLVQTLHALKFSSIPWTKHIDNNRGNLSTNYTPVTPLASSVPQLLLPGCCSLLQAPEHHRLPFSPLVFLFGSTYTDCQSQLCVSQAGEPSLTHCPVTSGTTKGILK